MPYANPNNYVKLSGRLAERLARERPEGAIWANQFDNLANRRGHERSTAIEIWDATLGMVDGFICAVGTGGTLAGVSLGLKARNPAVQIGIADPMGAALYDWYTHGELRSEGSSITEGIGQNRITANLEGVTVDHAYQIGDEEALQVLYRLAQDEGLLLGGSAGINVAGAIALARTMGPGHTLVTILCDSGFRYASKLYNPVFLRAKDLPVPPWLERLQPARERPAVTELLFREDAGRRSTEAVVEAVDPLAGVVLDRTVFYVQGGGQPGDTGVLRLADGRAIPVLDTVYGPDRTTVLHRVGPADAVELAAGMAVEAVLDWPKRFARMRIHTALHLLTTVLAFPVTGGSIGEGEGRLDFDMPEAGERGVIETQLNALVDRDLPVSTRWISDAELLANPGLVKTMSVKPPIGSGRVRLVAIGDVDLQPCGGTHVASTGEIGRLVVTGIEKKGKQNRRVRIGLADRPLATGESA